MALARILVFALALAHSVGLADLVMDDACEEVCSDDDCGTDCMPGAACRCHCPSAMPAVGGTVQVAAKGAMPPVIESFCVDQCMHASPDPREILHVPKHVV